MNALKLQPKFDNTLTTTDIKEEINKLTPPQTAFTGMELLLRDIKEIPTLVDPIFPKIGLCSVAGSSDTGKSSFLRQMAMGICSGDSSFLGFKLKPQHRRAVYVSTEDDDLAVSFLLNKANKDLQKQPRDFSGLQFIFDSQNLIEKLEIFLKQQPADVIIIDAFTDLYGKSMNDSNMVRTFLNEYSQLAQRYKTLVIFLHHTGKRTEDLAPSKHNLLGSQGFEAKMRLVIELRNDLSDPDKRHLCIVKGNYLSKEYKNESYVFTFNENLTFEGTGERTPFDELRADNTIEKKELVRNLKNEGLTQNEIQKKTGISQATISRYLNDKN